MLNYGFDSCWCLFSCCLDDFVGLARCFDLLVLLDFVDFVVCFDDLLFVALSVFVWGIWVDLSLLV